MSSMPVFLCSGCTGRKLLLGNCSCIALISDIPVTMHFLQSLPRELFASALGTSARAGPVKRFGSPWRSYARGRQDCMEAGGRAMSGTIAEDAVGEMFKITAQNQRIRFTQERRA